VCLHLLHHDREEAVQERDDLVRRAANRQARRAEHVHEDDRHLAQLAAQLDVAVALQRRLRHLAADVAPEQVTQPLALVQAGRHGVEAGLQQADLAAVVDRHAGVVVALLHAGHRPPHGRDRLRHRARGDRDREGADHQADHGEQRDRTRQQRGILVGIDHAGGGRGQDPEQRDPGAERPGHREPAGDSWPCPLRCGSAGQGEHGDGPDDPLVQQVGDRAGRLAAEQHRAADDQGRPAVCRHVDRREHDRGDRPEARGDGDDLGRGIEYAATLLRRGRPARVEPALDRLATP
jgi:hypothetical protein